LWLGGIIILIGILETLQIINSISKILNQLQIKNTNVNNEINTNTKISKEKIVYFIDSTIDNGVPKLNDIIENTNRSKLLINSNYTNSQKIKSKVKNSTQDKIFSNEKNHIDINYFNAFKQKVQIKQIYKKTILLILLINIIYLLKYQV